jgi:hypothetical protein
MVSKIPDRPTHGATQPPNDPATRAAYLWSLLDLTQSQLDSLCLAKPEGIISEPLMESMNAAFLQVKRLIGNDIQIQFLPHFSKENPPTNAEAEEILQLYRQSLRWYKTDYLHEDPYLM